MVTAPVVPLGAVVHPIDIRRFPTVPAGWRWCVQLGRDWSDEAAWANAGWAPTETEARALADQNAATAARVLQLLGIPFDYRGPVAIDHDPCPADPLAHIGG